MAFNAQGRTYKPWETEERKDFFDDTFFYLLATSNKRVKDFNAMSSLNAAQNLNKKKYKYYIVTSTWANQEFDVGDGEEALVPRLRK